LISKKNLIKSLFLKVAIFGSDDCKIDSSFISSQWTLSLSCLVLDVESPILAILYEECEVPYPLLLVSSLLKVLILG